ncbi:hypothetical protein [Streptomyces sp. NBC_00286]|uniref:hypothetical protein n=1 Tax=Streptomyces sp. NBC_00286 TaxID=2975701 RepID=UPI002E27E4A1|nr:hypothetical protein [Streptomyces sp. NBC_00286]
MPTASPSPGSSFLDRKVLGKELEELLNEHSSQLAVRKAELAALADDLTHGNRLDRWAEIDLVHSYVRPESVTAPPPAAPAQPWRRWIPGHGLLEAALGVLVFIPLLVTWFGLREAVRAYGELAAEDRDQATRPFLQLWQTGFGGHLSAMGRFENVALMAVVLITGLVLLSVAHAYVRAQTERKEQDREAGDERLLGALAALLTRVQMCLTPHRAASPDQFTKELTRTARQLQNLLKQADGSHQKLVASATAVGDATDALQKAAGALSSEVPGIAKAADRVEAAVKASMSASDQVRQDSKDAARTVADRVQAAGDAMQTAVTSLITAQQALAAKSDAVAQSAERAAQAVAAGAGRTNDAVDGMREATERWDAAAAHWQDAAARLDHGIRVLSGGQLPPGQVNGARVPAPSNGADGGET